jgi:peptidoglycan/LPS O-acetylase OafA/YrhL
MSVAAALASVLVCGLARLEASNGTARRLAKVLGDSTYAIYLTHCFILGPAGSLAGRFAHGLPPLLFVVAAIPVCAGLGWLVYEYVDGPASKWFGTWLNKMLIVRTVGGGVAAAKLIP